MNFKSYGLSAYGLSAVMENADLNVHGILVRVMHCAPVHV